MAEPRMKTFNYAIGFFGMSIPINLLKTFAAAYYVIGLGLTTTQVSTILFVYAFIDAADNLVYGFLSDRTRTRWGRRRPWLLVHPLSGRRATRGRSPLLHAGVLPSTRQRSL